MKQLVKQRMKQATEKQNLFIPFITAGDPTADATVEIALALEEAGASILELGIPYSDPIADGPTIQAASKRALEDGMTLERALQLVPKMRSRGLKIPVIIFTYYNLLMQYGEVRFTEQASASGSMVCSFRICRLKKARNWLTDAKATICRSFRSSPQPRKIGSPKSPSKRKDFFTVFRL